MHGDDKNSIKNFTRGGQITFHNMRMWFQVNQTIFKICKVFWLICSILVGWAITPRYIYMAAWYWCQAQVYPILKLLDITLPVFRVPYHGRVYFIHPTRFLHIQVLLKSAHTFLYYAAVAVVIGLILTAVGFYLISKCLTKRGERQTEDKFIRGARLDNAENVAKQIKKRGGASNVVIDSLPVVAGSEVAHFLVHGTTGTGKTQLISKVLDCLRKTNDKVLIYDKGGVYTSTFYRGKQDRLLNPLDARSENWDLWSEARVASDFANIAASLIPENKETEPYWVNSARTLFANVAYSMQEDKDRSIKKLLQLLLKSKLKDLYTYIADTEAVSLLSDKLEKTALSIRSVITTYIKSLGFLTGLEQTSKSDFSIIDWMHRDTGDQWLFIPSNASQHESLRPLISMWFSMASISLLSLLRNKGSRIWFICDELPSLHQQPFLANTMAESRKFGGCFILGMQNYAQLENIYNPIGAKDIFDLMNTRFFFRNPSAEIAELVSRELGSEEVEEIRENYSYGANTIRDGISIGSQRMISRIITPAEVMDLEPMNCYVRSAGNYPIAKLTLAYKQREKICPSFIDSDIKPDQEIVNLIDSADSKVRKMKLVDPTVKRSQKEREHKKRKIKMEINGNQENKKNQENKSKKDQLINNAPGNKVVKSNQESAKDSGDSQDRVHEEQELFG